MPLPLFAEAPNAPGWWAWLVVQFPVVALVFLAVRWAVRSSDSRYAEFFAQYQDAIREHREAEGREVARLSEAIDKLREQYEAAIKEMRAATDDSRREQERRHSEELERLRESHKAHVRTMNATIRHLRNLIPEQGEPGGHDD